MVKIAKKRYVHPQVQYDCSSIYNLDMAKKFDACYMDRFLVSENAPQKAISFISKFLKSKGRFCVTDVDASTITLSPNNTVVEKVLKEINRCFVNQNLGRQLPKLLFDAGFRKLDISVHASSIKDFNTVENLFKFKQILNGAISENRLTQKQANQFRVSMQEATKKGFFLYSILIYTVTGHKTN